MPAQDGFDGDDTPRPSIEVLIGVPEPAVALPADATTTHELRPRKLASAVALVGAIAAAVWILAGAPLRSPTAEGAITSSLPVAQLAPERPRAVDSPSAPLPRPAVQITPLVTEPAVASDADANRVDAPVVPDTVTWKITTRPAGARVIRESDGADLGRTPLVLDVPAGDGQAALSLRRDGYRASRTILPRDRNANASIELQRVRGRVRAATPAARPAVTRPLRPSGPVADDALDPYGD
jgi:hypothetical protein